MTMPAPAGHRRYNPDNPPDLITLGEAAAALAASPYPMSTRDLDRRYNGRRFTHPQRRGVLVSRSAVYEWHRDYWSQRG